MASISVPGCACGSVERVRNRPSGALRSSTSRPESSAMVTEDTAGSCISSVPSRRTMPASSAFDIRPSAPQSRRSRAIVSTRLNRPDSAASTWRVARSSSACATACRAGSYSRPCTPPNASASDRAATASEDASRLLPMGMRRCGGCPGLPESIVIHPSTHGAIGGHRGRPAPRNRPCQPPSLVQPAGALRQRLARRARHKGTKSLINSTVGPPMIRASLLNDRRRATRVAPRRRKDYNQRP